MFFIYILSGLVLLDIFLDWQLRQSSLSNKRMWRWVVWGMSIGMWVVAVVTFLFRRNGPYVVLFAAVFLILGNVVGKTCAAVPLLMGQLVRYVDQLVRWVRSKVSSNANAAKKSVPNQSDQIDQSIQSDQSDLGTDAELAQTMDAQPISRGRFLMRAALVSGCVPIAGMVYGIAYGAHNYQVYNQDVYLSHLPKAFDGLRVLQLSDLHVGSFVNRRAVAQGIDLVMEQKADVIVFTGDLVNRLSNEVRGYEPLMRRLRAPLGVYSILGNHDYGDYGGFSSEQAKAADFRRICQAQQAAGWRLLRNEHIILGTGADTVALIGSENWSARGRFRRYGNMKQATQGMEAACQILLSHDPSHWEAEICKKYPEVELMLAGHTHGFQFGVEVGDWKWSPVQYIYPQWAGLYQNTPQNTSNVQQLYVNRGFGFVGYPGRIGIPPEITVLHLRCA